jgi:hypothetical protein
VTGTTVSSRGLTLLGTTDLGDRPDSLQIMLSRGHAFVTHPFSGGFTVADVRDPRSPRCVAHVPAPPGTTTLHLQLSDDILLVANEANTSTRESFRDKETYFGEQLGTEAAVGLDYSGGVRIYDVSTPAEPVEIGMLDLPGFGVHRLWWTGGGQALASSMPTGEPDFLLTLLDMSDPVRPRAVHHWAPPDGTASSGRLSLHHAILDGTVAYGAWRAGGLQMVNFNGGQPRALGGITPDAWGGGNTHTTLPLPGRNLVAAADESVLEGGADGLRRIWLLDVTDPAEPQVVSALPEPAEQDFRGMGGMFGPHNLHENRPGTWKSETVLFATYQNAGVRAYDISDAREPVEIAYCVPPGPARTVDPRVSHVVRVPQTADVLVTQDGLVLASDLNGGLSLMQFEGTP